MEKNQALAVAAGVGAIGTLVGYLGYSYLNNIQPVLENEEESLTEKKEEKLTSMWSKFWASEYKDFNKEEETTEEETTEEEKTEKQEE
jgi:hypothetical protein